MINSVNSYTTYYINLISKDKTNNLENTKESSLNSVSDKSRAVNKVLGYGVDKDGFFTSDFNEAANLPKDYKIDVNWIKNLDKTLTTAELTTKALYDYIDWAKEFGNFYKENLQTLDKFGENFNKEQIQKEFNISLKDNFTKGDVLLGIFATTNKTKIKEGKNTLFGKTYGLDNNINQKEMNEFYAFMQKNQIKDPNKIEKSSFKNILFDTWMGVDRERNKLRAYTSYAVDFHLDSSLVKKAKDFEDEFDKLLKEDLSLDEFKNKYMDFKKRHDEFVKEYEIAMGDNLLVKSIEKENKFKAIKGESQNKETYQNKDTNDLLKKLLENKFNLSKELEILFGVKIDDEKLNNNDFTKIFSNANLHNIKSVDLKA